MVAAARDLFLDTGYGATTIDAISEAAGVPAPTLYRLFSSKLGVLKAILDVSIVGDDDAVAMEDRPEVQNLLDAPDARAKLQGFVAVTIDVNERVAPLYRILVSAAGSDAGAADLLGQLTEQRQAGQRTIARSLARSGSLREGLRERDAADLIHALMSPELYRLLVLDRGWTRSRYSTWLSETLEAQLLPSGG